MTVKTPIGLQLLSEMREPLRAHLRQVDIHVGINNSPEIEYLKTKLRAARNEHINSADEVLNDIFVLEKYALLFEGYGRIWQQISSSQYSESWDSLQSVFDMVRIIRRFSNIDISAVEDQLYALETAYPYNMFFSMGAVVEWFKCSICEEDMDTFSCVHRKGELYRGEMAYGIAMNVRFDHVAIVGNPVDKRCVVSYPNESSHFDVVRYIGELFFNKKLLVSEFGGIFWGKRKIKNPEYRHLKRNDQCYCNSGRKFKRCCIGKNFIEQDHAQIIPTKSQVTRTVV